MSKYFVHKMKYCSDLKAKECFKLHISKLIFVMNESNFLQIASIQKKFLHKKMNSKRRCIDSI